MTRTLAVIDCGSSKVPEIGAEGVRAGLAVTQVPLDAANGWDFGRFHAVIISGGPHLFTDPETARRLPDQFRFLDDLRRPVLGICLGHQALGVRRGVAVTLGPPRRQDETVTLLADHPLLAGFGRTATFRADHTEGIPVPPGFLHLGRSAHYVNEIMAAADRPHFGVQFHPEVSGAAGRRLFDNFFTLAAAYEPT